MEFVYFFFKIVKYGYVLFIKIYENEKFEFDNYIIKEINLNS